MSNTYELIVSDITVSPDGGDAFAVAEARKRINRYAGKSRLVSAAVYRCSVDARRRNNVRLVYSVLCVMEGALPDKAALSAMHGSFAAAPFTLDTLPLPKKQSEPPVIVGMGPAGLFAALVITREVDGEWIKWYFDWLREKCDPWVGMSYGGRLGNAPLNHHLNGWFHYLFNHNYSRMPFPYPERLIDSCLAMYKSNSLGANFGKACEFAEIDWVFAVHRSMRQTTYRYQECKNALRDFAKKYIANLEALDDREESLNDLHKLFGAVCCLAELQLALPGEVTSTVPLKIVLDRRPFI